MEDKGPRILLNCSRCPLSSSVTWHVWQTHLLPSGLVVCWSQLVPACKSQLLNFQEYSIMFRNFTSPLTSRWELEIGRSGIIYTKESANVTCKSGLFFLPPFPPSLRPSLPAFLPLSLPSSPLPVSPNLESQLFHIYEHTTALYQHWPNSSCWYSSLSLAEGFLQSSGMLLCPFTGPAGSIQELMLLRASLSQ